MIRHTVPTPSPLWGEGRVRGPVVRGPVVRGPVVGGPVVRGLLEGGAAAGATGTSTVSTAPPGPDPRSAASSTPRSAASRRAFGDAATSRPPGAPLVGAALRLSTNASTSAFSILPLADLMRARSTPCSSAIRRASGEALIASSRGPPPPPLPPRGGGGGGAGPGARRGGRGCRAGRRR